MLQTGGDFLTILTKKFNICEKFWRQKPKLDGEYFTKPKKCNIILYYCADVRIGGKTAYIYGAYMK